MGSVEDPQPQVEEEIVVLVTGFGPFGNRYPVNPSWELAKSLPPLIPISSKTHPCTSTLSSLPSSPKNVRILVHPTPVKVAYATVRDLVPKLWASHPKIDYMVHVGMASGREFYSVERRGHRDGYYMGDVDGVVLGDEKHKKREDGEKWIWEDCPDELLSSVDIDDVWRRWRTARPDNDIRISEDAGRYLCDFIYYSSLAHLWMRKEERRTVFLHVPVDSDEGSLLKGKEILEELIRSLAVSGMMKSFEA